MDPALDEAYSDADAICVCLGALAFMTMHAREMAQMGARIVAMQGTDDGLASIRDRAAFALKRAREQMDAAMQDLGEYFNCQDACSATMSDVTAPAYELLRKRRDGISTAD